MNLHLENFVGLGQPLVVEAVDLFEVDLDQLYVLEDEPFELPSPVEVPVRGAESEDQLLPVAVVELFGGLKAGTGRRGQGGELSSREEGGLERELARVVVGDRGVQDKG